MFNLKKNIKFLLTIILLYSLIDFSIAYSAASSGSSSSSTGGDDKVSLYKEGKKLVRRAKKLEKKNKLEKANKLYLKAYDKLWKAYKIGLEAHKGQKRMIKDRKHT